MMRTLGSLHSWVLFTFPLVIQTSVFPSFLPYILFQSNVTCFHGFSFYFYIDNFQNISCVGFLLNIGLSSWDFHLNVLYSVQIKHSPKWAQDCFSSSVLSNSKWLAPPLSRSFQGLESHLCFSFFLDVLELLLPPLKYLWNRATSFLSHCHHSNLSQHYLSIALCNSFLLSSLYLILPY